LILDGWNEEEASGAEQIGLLNMALLQVSYDLNNKTPKFGYQAEAAFMEALTTPKRMHVASTEKLLSYLMSYFNSIKDEKRHKEVSAVANAYGFSSSNRRSSITRAITRKRVVFSVDYSGSMSGSKIKAAVENINNVFEKHIVDGDTVMLMHFSNYISVDFDLTVKSPSTNGFMLSKINSLTSPNGGTAFYDSIFEAINKLSMSPGTSDWIVALTDGEDNASRNKLDASLEALLKKSPNMGLIVIGVGIDVKTEELTKLTSMCSKGIYVSAAGDKKSIDKAFDQVIEIISQGAVVLEEV